MVGCTWNPRHGKTERCDPQGSLTNQPSPVGKHQVKIERPYFKTLTRRATEEASCHLRLTSGTHTHTHTFTCTLTKCSLNYKPYVLHNILLRALSRPVFSPPPSTGMPNTHRYDKALNTRCFHTNGSCLSFYQSQLFKAEVLKQHKMRFTEMHSSL